MKILYIGSIISEKLADEITLASKRKPSTAAVNFQRNLLKGFSVENADIEVYSIVPVAMYPGSPYLTSPREKESRIFQYNIKQLQFVNLPIFKQISIFFSVLFSVLFWCIRNRKTKEKCVLVYGQYVYAALPQIMLCRMLHIKSCNIVTDPIRYTSNYSLLPIIKRMMLSTQWFLMERIKCGYSAFILLTEAMIDEYITGETPYIILEGIADTAIFEGIPAMPKVYPPVIMYAGALTDGFGISKLLDAIPAMKTKAQLWLFGAGDCEERIKQEQMKSPNIVFWGKVPWKEMLQHMTEASVLVSVKPTDQSHTQFQFPSKIMEYMASGTPVASTMVEGIPAEYFEYIYPIPLDNADGITKTLDMILSLDEDDRKAKGALAKQFISEEKNCHVQAKRILQVLNRIVRNCG